VVTDDRHSVQATGELEDTSAVGTAVDEVSAEREAMLSRVEPSGREQVVQLGRTALNVTHAQYVAHVSL
jgi:hypothetical protein